jgi:hypothetical protein
MICEACHGSGTTTVRKLPRHLLPPRPCAECGGTGITSCCDAAGSAQPVPAWPYFIVKERRMAVMDMFAPVKGKPAVNHVRPPWPKEGNPREDPSTSSGQAEKAEPKETAAREPKGG